MGVKIKIDGVKYRLCQNCGVYHKTSKGKKNKRKVVCVKNVVVK
ncbi:hypothetical protein ACIFOT_12975 [Neobacillus sp. NRS-1170]